MDVAVFCFNRPDKLRMCLDSIDVSHVETLWIFCDGARNVDDEAAVSRTRQVAAEFSAQHKRVVLRPTNFSPPRNVISGLDEVFNQTDRCLILEDDCIVRPEAYTYVAWALEKYLRDTRVFSVNTMAPLNGPLSRIARLFVKSDVIATSRIFAFWGWATWADRWKAFRRDLEPFRNPYGRASATPVSYGTHIRWALERFEEGKVGAWDARLAVLVGHANKLHLHPTRSLMRNIGFDGSGVHYRDAEPPITQLRDLRFSQFVPNCSATYPATENRAVRFLHRVATFVTLARVRCLAAVPDSLRVRVRRAVVRKRRSAQY